MQVIRGLQNIRQQHKGGIVTIGNFDGLHLGHIQLLAQLKRKADELDRPTIAITFEPQPNEFFSPDENVARLMRFREKINAFKGLGIDYVLCLRFNHKLSVLSPEEFVIQLLVNKLAITSILVGDDFRFGYQRSGDFSLLQEMGREYQFKVEKMPTYKVLDERVSSTRIRKLLKAGQLDSAKALLGRPYTLQGMVTHGDKRGRLLGFPTANIHLWRKKVPLSGVFVVNMLGVANHPVAGIANLGTRPTFSGEVRTLLEVHLFDFNQNIYRKKVTIQFLTKLRSEQKFESADALIQQIRQDVVLAKEFLSRQRSLK